MSNILKKILKFILISLGIFTGGILVLIILFIILSYSKRKRPQEKLKEKI